MIQVNLFTHDKTNEILEISLLKPGENESIEKKIEDVDQPCKNVNHAIENETKQDQIEPEIGIIKLGEDSKVNSTLVKNLICEHCGKLFSKTNQLFVHTRIHTSKILLYSFTTPDL